MGRDPARQALIEAHVDYVRSLARRMVKELGFEGDVDELTSAGMEGLIDAADRFDLTVKTRFTTFAYYRIRGAMLDSVRNAAALPRRTYERARELARQNGLLMGFADRQVVADPAAPLPATPPEAALLVEALEAVAVDHLLTLAAAPDDAGPRNPDDRLAALQTRAVVRDALAGLPDDERRLVEACYFEEQSLAEAGAGMGLSRSWASRLHARALGRLKKRLLARGAGVAG